jgi:hypothetical protein
MDRLTSPSIEGVFPDPDAARTGSLPTGEAAQLELLAKLQRFLESAAGLPPGGLDVPDVSLKKRRAKGGFPSGEPVHRDHRKPGRARARP